MTNEDIALVRQGFALVAPNAEAVGIAFYEWLFARDPGLRPLFRGEPAQHARNLMAALTMVVGSLDDLTPILGKVRALGARHAGYGVVPAHFATVAAALLETLEAGLGDAFTPPARAAWTRAYTVLSGAMISAMEEQRAAAA